MVRAYLIDSARGTGLLLGLQLSKQIGHNGIADASKLHLMIAHRISTLDICDARIELEHGRIIGASGKVDLDRSLSGNHPSLRVTG